MTHVPTAVPTDPSTSATRKRKWKLPTAIGVSTFLLGLMIGGGGSSAAPSTAATTTETLTVTAAAETVTETVTVEPQAPAPDAFTPNAKDVKLTLKQQEKTCYGSAGCNITTQVRLAVDFSKFPKEGGLTIYYKITGGEDPIEGTLVADLSDGTYDKETELISTASKSKKLAIKVTDIEYTH